MAEQSLTFLGAAGTLTFLGAAGTVTGSKHLLDVAGRRILVDCGMFQGDKALREQNWQPLLVPPSSIDTVLVTHAHIDHTGYLPRLVRDGFSGQIWGTDATKLLTEIVLRDSANLQEQDAKDAAAGGYSKHANPQPLYTMDDVEAVMTRFKVVNFDTDVDLGDDIHACYYRAGHILGSASIRVSAPGLAVAFSGDLGRRDHPVLRARQVPPSAPVVLIESTYGDREHPEEGSLPHEELADAIRRTVARGGSVLVPAFAVDRTEVLLKTLAEMKDAKRIPDIPIFIDSPMGLKALQVYQDPSQRHELRDDLKDADFLDLANVREVTTTQESIALNHPKMPCILISSSGMATGGRVVHHLEHMLPDHRNTVVFTGYQAASTRGADLVAGAKQLKMFGKLVPVAAEVLMDEGFSVHGDQTDLMSWLAAMDPKPTTVYVVHGEQGAPVLAAKIRDQMGIEVVVPKLGDHGVIS